LLASESDAPLAFVFADNGTRTVPASIQYQYSSPIAARNFVAKLKPNTKYTINSLPVGSTVTITLTENVTGTASDAAGVLSFMP